MDTQQNNESNNKQGKNIALVIAIIILLVFFSSTMGVMINSMNEYKTQNEELKKEIEDIKSNDYDILPCPFCGSENVKLAGYDSSFGMYVICEDCSAASGSHYYDGSQRIEFTENDAIEDWNSVPR